MERVRLKEVGVSVPSLEVPLLRGSSEVLAVDVDVNVDVAVDVARSGEGVGGEELLGEVEVRLRSKVRRGMGLWIGIGSAIVTRTALVSEAWRRKRGIVLYHDVMSRAVLLWSR